jgi:hypothetical protein
MRYAIIFLLIMMVSGCHLAQRVERYEVVVKPIIDYYTLGGYTGQAEENLFVISGTQQEVREKLHKIIVEGFPPQTTFSPEEEINFVVFRGVFSTGGYGLEIQKVERQGNFFFISARYIDPGSGMMVTHAFTQPTAIIPIGRLERGDYYVVLFVSQIRKTKEGDQIIYEEKERKRVEFAVR